MSSGAKPKLFYEDTTQNAAKFDRPSFVEEGKEIIYTQRINFSNRRN